MNRTDLASTIAQRTGVTVKDATAVIAGLNDVILEAIGRGEKIQLPGLLTIERVERSARTGRNPQTGAEIQIPASHAAKITAGSKLKAAAKG
ncbi:DNA-binding protein HU-beta [Branchiibius hedensis]|uniref:DNA-binding protein HU-beta n=1 Tax=Branchiibius hedensis TaxID=672460 RepID=A0A2Y8ZW37_9MICO|nr:MULTISPECIES: HU family DNA-binding protein [Branchiibius]KYH44996.1 integration host factor [Branchiibius sp. NY16-3462-2]PWJ27344.1 DNA-binding protein HU-beta [Branchiibius hedensis]SSA36155.1 DNA-binding protein HU-beta [Branchiibius hedensis]